jgi:hypothetical protein
MPKRIHDAGRLPDLSDHQRFCHFSPETCPGGRAAWMLHSVGFPERTERDHLVTGLAGKSRTVGARGA